MQRVDEELVHLDSETIKPLDNWLTKSSYDTNSNANDSLKHDASSGQGGSSGHSRGLADS